VDESEAGSEAKAKGVFVAREMPNLADDFLAEIRRYSQFEVLDFAGEENKLLLKGLKEESK